MHACEHANVPRTLTPNIRSKRFIGVSSVLVSEIALALFTQDVDAAESARRFSSRLPATAFSSRISTCMGNACCRAASIASAAV